MMLCERLSMWAGYGFQWPGVKSQTPQFKNLYKTLGFFKPVFSWVSSIYVYLHFMVGAILPYSVFKIKFSVGKLTGRRTSPKFSHCELSLDLGLWIPALVHCLYVCCLYLDS